MAHMEAPTEAPSAPPNQGLPPEVPYINPVRPFQETPVLLGLQVPTSTYHIPNLSLPYTECLFPLTTPILVKSLEEC